MWLWDVVLALVEEDKIASIFKKLLKNTFKNRYSIAVLYGD
jgi:hypothetical protein